MPTEASIARDRHGEGSSAISHALKEVANASCEQEHYHTDRGKDKWAKVLELLDNMDCQAGGQA